MSDQSFSSKKSSGENSAARSKFDMDVEMEYEKIDTATKTMHTIDKGFYSSLQNLVIGSHAETANTASSSLLPIAPAGEDHASNQCRTEIIKFLKKLEIDELLKSTQHDVLFLKLEVENLEKSVHENERVAKQIDDEYQEMQTKWLRILGNFNHLFSNFQNRYQLIRSQASGNLILVKKDIWELYIQPRTTHLARQIATLNQRSNFLVRTISEIQTIWWNCVNRKTLIERIIQSMRTDNSGSYLATNKQLQPQISDTVEELKKEVTHIHWEEMGTTGNSSQKYVDTARAFMNSTITKLEHLCTVASTLDNEKAEAMKTIAGREKIDLALKKLRVHINQLNASMDIMQHAKGTADRIVEGDSVFRPSTSGAQLLS